MRFLFPALLLTTAAPAAERLPLDKLRAAVTADTQRNEVLLERLVWAAAEGLPFERLAVLVHRQSFTKTANCWGVSNNTAGTNTNRVVLLRRVAAA